MIALSSYCASLGVLLLESLIALLLQVWSGSGRIRRSVALFSGIDVALILLLLLLPFIIFIHKAVVLTVIEAACLIVDSVLLASWVEQLFAGR